MTVERERRLCHWLLSAALMRTPPHEVDSALRAIATDAGATPNQVVLVWMTGQGIIPVTGVSTLQQLAETLGAFDLELSEAQMNALNEAGAP